MYPPSATSTYAFDAYDQDYSVCGGQPGADGDGNSNSNSKYKYEYGGKGREFWTGPPIVELIPAKGEERRDRFVRVTLQGIPSVFWKEDKDKDGDSSGSGSSVRKDDMVPLSLVFEACFEPEKRD